MQKEQARKSTIFTEAEQQHFSNGTYDNPEESNTKKSKAFENAQAQRKMNQSRNFISQLNNLSLNVKKELQYFKITEIKSLL